MTDTGESLVSAAIKRDGVIHLRNSRGGRHPQTFGEGATWCGKKLLGNPEAVDGIVETFSSYGNRVHATIDPAGGSCPQCRDAFDTAYAEAFPDGLKPIATFYADNPEDVSRAKALFGPDAMRHFFSPGGAGQPCHADVLHDLANAQEGPLHDRHRRLLDLGFGRG